MAALTNGPTELPGEKPNIEVLKYMAQMRPQCSGALCIQEDSCAASCRAQAVHALVRDERRLREEREAFRSKRAEYSGFSRGDMLSAQGSANAPGGASLRRSVCH